MANTERVHGLAIRWQAALIHRKQGSQWDLGEARRAIIRLIEVFPESPALEVLDWVAGTIEKGEGPITFGALSEVASPMQLIRNDYRGFRMAVALCPIRCS